MAELSELRIAVCQAAVVEGRDKLNNQVRIRMLERARELGAHIAVFPRFGSDEPIVVGVEPNLVFMGGRDDDGITHVLVDSVVGAFNLSLGSLAEQTSMVLMNDESPWYVGCQPSNVRCEAPVIVVKPVGIRTWGKRVTLHSGGSYALDTDGKLVMRMGDDFGEDIEIVTFDGGKARIEESSSDMLMPFLVEGIRRFDEVVMPWHPNWIIGLSGGLDSSVVAALLVKALGAERVIGYNLATRYNSAATKSNAGVLADALGIRLKSTSIEDLVIATGTVAAECGYEPASMKGLVAENVQARLRGHMLSTFAAAESGVVVNNGNRVECAIGYATLYGDAIGALAPIADLTKVQLFDLAQQINKSYGREVIPTALLPRETEDGYEWQTMPSAELADGQVDPMKWFYHDWLVEQLLDATDGFGRSLNLDVAACQVMHGYLRDRLASTKVGKWVSYYGLDDPAAFIADLECMMRQIRNSAFKRIQAPPRLAVAKGSIIGPADEMQGIVEPSVHFDRLREAILKL